MAEIPTGKVLIKSVERNRYLAWGIVFTPEIRHARLSELCQTEIGTLGNVFWEIEPRGDKYEIRHHHLNEKLYSPAGDAYCFDDQRRKVFTLMRDQAGLSHMESYERGIWIIEPLEDGRFTIRNCHTNEYLCCGEKKARNWFFTWREQWDRENPQFLWEIIRSENVPFFKMPKRDVSTSWYESRNIFGVYDKN